MKKIKINQYLFAVLSFVLFILFIGGVFTGIATIIFGEIPTKTSGVIKYSFEESLNISFFSIIIGLFLYLFINYFEPIKNNDNRIFFSKCPKCKKTFNYQDLDKGKCPKCKKVDTLDLEEYFEIYPKEKEK